MTRIQTILSLQTLLSFISVPFTYAQDAMALIEDLQLAVPAMIEDSTSVLLPFAMEWDMQASALHDKGFVVMPSEYQALAVGDSARLNQSITALAKNESAMRLYTDNAAIAAFNQVYQQASNEGSSIGMIPRDDALLYWVLSRSIIEGPDAISNFREVDGSQELCLPPFIRCTPPNPSPPE
ncbi:MULTISPECIES: hypothetical protein [unclassified Yoonia]|uniref:hypothetical protein n=1 Tax=unclassified Yoonia TaxID=2629118 RepID=UPI002B003E32|nr:MULTISPECIES: hypothetical protein [unclassified Yoonia]